MRTVAILALSLLAQAAAFNLSPITREFLNIQIVVGLFELKVWRRCHADD